jgi:hypothetical protein
MKNRDELDGKVEQVKGGEAGLGDLTNNEGCATKALPTRQPGRPGRVRTREAQGRRIHRRLGENIKK